VFQISDSLNFWNICIYIMSYLGDGTQVHTKNLFMFHRHFIHIALQVILCDIFSASLF
jgi:hypothetical protein